MEKIRFKKVIKFLDRKTIIRVVSSDINVFGIKEYKLEDIPNEVIKFGAVSYFGKKEGSPLIEVYIPQTFCWRLFIWLDNIFEENDYGELRSARPKCHCFCKEERNKDFYSGLIEFNSHNSQENE